MREINLAGQIFGHLTATSRTATKVRNSYVYECLCSCGKTVLLPSVKLRQESAFSCGQCIASKPIVDPSRIKRLGKNNHGYVLTACRMCKTEQWRRRDFIKIWHGFCRRCIMVQLPLNLPRDLPGAQARGWKGGFPSCVDCGIALKHYRSTICNPCIGKRKRGLIHTGKPYSRSRGRARWWSDEIRKLDRSCCRNCGTSSGRLEAHHIKPLAEYPELAFDLDNGIPLCVHCHRKADNRRRQFLPVLLKAS